ncbi:MAG TPA: sulfatase [Phycisphaerales bacterium]|nr:sulfatase [Phycisphaerales bacterium]HCD34954.1 sulfatase [Phycisphaerales bacterium]|tara:strand:- start:187 stop:1632 length:1446 start_codon:yes stop_codon:yes gene_type:complete
MRNILLIIADQLTLGALGCTDNPNVHTPNIDSLFQNGVGLKRCYSQYPLCGPVRASFWTGRLPHQTGVMSNGGKFENADINEQKIPTLGQQLVKAGYHAIHFGKNHDYGALDGFECLPREEVVFKDPDGWPLNYDSFLDEGTTRQVEHYFQSMSGKPADKPFMAVADLNNPHNICGYIGEHIGKHDNPPYPEKLPELPSNFEFDDYANRPRSVQYICCAHRRQAQTAGWSRENFQHYLAAYYHYVDMTDRNVGRILAALDESGQRQNTTILFMADHGDNVASRGMTTKHTSFYEQTTRVPMILSGKDIPSKGQWLDTALFSLMDLAPTICDLAGTQMPDAQPGHGISMLPYATGQKTDHGHDYVVSQWHTEWGFTVEPGRMLCTGRYKYTRYLEDVGPSAGEEFFDLQNDPDEKRSLIHDPDYATELNRHRQLFATYLKETGDDFLTHQWEAKPRYRSHESGYNQHTGLCAPDFEEMIAKQ